MAKNVPFGGALIALLASLSFSAPALALKTSVTYRVSIDGSSAGSWVPRNLVQDIGYACRYIMRWRSSCTIDEFKASANIDCEEARRRYFGTGIMKADDQPCGGEDESGQRVIDFRKNNLHVLGYSVPVDQWLSLEELQAHLYSLPEQPDAIPYLTTYYKERWGFCLEDRKRLALKPGSYRAVIRSRLEAGSMTYGHRVLPSTTGGTDEILFSSYVCHPSMANNESSWSIRTKSSRQP